MGFVKRLVASLGMVVALGAAMPALALAHDNSITASSTCTSQSNNTWQATFKVSNDYNVGENAFITGAVNDHARIEKAFPGQGAGSVPAASQLSHSWTVAGSGASVTAGTYGVWDDGVKTGPPANHTATAFKPANCSPVIHTPAIQGSATCAQKTGTYTVTYTQVTADGGTTTTQFPIVHNVPGTSTSDSASATYTYGNGPDQTARATVQLAGTCVPVVHTPSFVGVTACGTMGRWKATYALVDAQGGTPSVSFPVVHGGLTGKTDSLKVTFSYQNGPDVTKTVTVVNHLTCRKIVPVIKRPSARLVGPCGDPYYGAVFNNSRSNHAVTFIWSYVNFYTDNRVSVRVKVAAGRIHDVAFRHVLGNTRMTIRTASGKVLASAFSAPPGNYGACRF